MADWWSKTIYQLADGKASEVTALNALDIIAFYQLLDQQLKNYKPAS